MEDQDRKRYKVEETPITGGTVIGLPFELTRRIFLSSVDRKKHPFAQLKILRLVSRECNALATDMLIDYFIEHLEQKVSELISAIVNQLDQGQGNNRY